MDDLQMVRTIAGDVACDDLGVVNAHDHLFLTSAAMAGVELDNLEAATEEAHAFGLAGGGCIVQWSPAGTRRHLADLRRMSSTINIHIIAATGRHLRAHYPADADIAALSADSLTARFIDDIQHQRCGLIKIATGYWTLDPFERDHVAAAAAAAGHTGAPIAVHLERGTGASQVVDLLEDLGLQPEQIILGHLGRFPDLASIRAVLDRGVYACFDAPSLGNHATDWRTPGLLNDLINAGHLHQLLLGADTTSQLAQPASGGAPGTSNFLTWARQIIGPVVGTTDLSQILTTNAHQAYALRQ
ncbi:hypothetical protein [Branchiibius cervicis]|uniref:Phosphotriesterase n=1 Tax=Branchiibius cervicis TaxID=908252 RepID=A0ABW2AYD6_9MICO